MSSPERKRRRREYKKNWMKIQRESASASNEVAGQSSSREDFSLSEEEFLSEQEFSLDTSNHIFVNSSESEEVHGDENSVQTDSLREDLEQVNELHDDIDSLEEPMLSSSESDWESEDCADTLQDNLTKWANDHQITHNALDDLLKLLNSKFDTDLPLSARTLLKTVRDIDISEISGMRYVNLGFKEQLRINLNRYPEVVKSSIEDLEVSLNIDGIPIFKSTNSSLWPVLCSINLRNRVVFPVVLTYGASKPSNLDFLLEICEELKDILENGFAFDGRIISVILSCIVCDAPAKAMVKGVKLYSGYYGCDMCEQRGFHYSSRMTYPDIVNLNLRSNESFREQRQPGHHHKVTPFCHLDIDMIKTFPVDYMHQVCLGVTKRLILLWTKGPREVRISALQQQLISANLKEFGMYVPSVFARKPRGLDVLERWKATEFRQFLLYSGRYVLKGVLRAELYNHFLHLSAAISILVSKRLSAHRNFAHSLLTHFVFEGKELYGQEFLVYNVHSLLHLYQVASAFGSLDACSAFVFEDYMQVLKRYVRSGKEPMKQIVKRMLEIQKTCVSMRKKKERKVKTQFPNNIYFVGESDDVCEVIATSSERDEKGDKKKVCRVYTVPIPVFQSPIDSRNVGFFKFDQRKASLQVYPNAVLKRQAIMINDGADRCVKFMAILHDF